VGARERLHVGQAYARTRGFEGMLRNLSRGRETASALRTKEPRRRPNGGDFGARCGHSRLRRTHARATRRPARFQDYPQRICLPEEEHLPRGARASAPEAAAVTVNVTFREVLD